MHFGCFHPEFNPLFHLFSTPDTSFILPTKPLSYVRVLCFILFVFLFSCDSLSLFRAACMSMSRDFCLFMKAQAIYSWLRHQRKLFSLPQQPLTDSCSLGKGGGFMIPFSIQTGTLAGKASCRCPRLLWVHEYHPLATCRRQHFTAFIPTSGSCVFFFFLFICDVPWVLQRLKHMPPLGMSLQWSLILSALSSHKSLHAPSPTANRSLSDRTLFSGTSSTNLWA